jgi:glucose-1-phosphate thymidylyltransferase
VSDLAIIGIYYFKDGENLRKELQYLIDHSILDKGEFQLTSALENMKTKGLRFSPGKVQEWLDCGNKDSTVHSNKRVLEFSKTENLVAATCKKTNSMVIPPCFIGENVELINSVVGPYVSIGNDTVVEDSIIQNSIIQTHTRLTKVHLQNSMIGNYVDFNNCRGEMSIGDYSSLNN